MKLCSLWTWIHVCVVWITYVNVHLLFVYGGYKTRNDPSHAAFSRYKRVLKKKYSQVLARQDKYLFVPYCNSTRVGVLQNFTIHVLYILGLYAEEIYFRLYTIKSVVGAIFSLLMLHNVPDSSLLLSSTTYLTKSVYFPAISRCIFHSCLHKVYGDIDETLYILWDLTLYRR